MSDALKQAFESWVPPPPQLIEYRLYHDDQGRPLFMASSGFPDSGNYILISRELYDRANYSNLRVVNGELKVIDISGQHRVQLHKSDSGFSVVNGHANLLVEKADNYTDIEYYDYKNY